MKESIQLPPKPKYGSPCNHCGVCCIQELCQIAEFVYPGHPAPCPALVVENGKALCGLVLIEEKSSLPKHIAKALGIGKGCCALDDDSNSNPNT